VSKGITLAMFYCKYGRSQLCFTELKPQVHVSHDINSPAFALYTTMGVGRGPWPLPRFWYL